jgi:hypothetical protein
MLKPFDYAILFLFIFWIGMLIDCLLNKQLNSKYKLLWMLVMLLASFFGAGLYFLIVFTRHFFKIGHLFKTERPQPHDGYDESQERLRRAEYLEKTLYQE